MPSPLIFSEVENFFMPRSRSASDCATHEHHRGHTDGSPFSSFLLALPNPEKHIAAPSLEKTLENTDSSILNNNNMIEFPTPFALYQETPQIITAVGFKKDCGIRSDCAEFDETPVKLLTTGLIESNTVKSISDIETANSVDKLQNYSIERHATADKEDYALQTPANISMLHFFTYKIATARSDVALHNTETFSKTAITEKNLEEISTPLNKTWPETSTQASNSIARYSAIVRQPIDQDIPATHLDTVSHFSDHTFTHTSQLTNDIKNAAELHYRGYELGPVDVEINVHDQRADIRIELQSDQIQQHIERELPRLEIDMNSRNLMMGQVNFGSKKEGSTHSGTHAQARQSAKHSRQRAGQSTPSSYSPSRIIDQMV